MRVLSKPYAVAIAGIITASFVVAGCGDSKDEGSGTNGDDSCDPNTELVLWRPGDVSSTPLRNAIDRFNETSECGTVKFEEVTDDTIDEKLRMTLGTDEGPDMFVSHGGAHLWEQASDPETIFMPASTEVADFFWPWAERLTTLNGVNYGIPSSGTEPVMLFYNKTILAENGLEVPETYDDLLAAVDVLAKTDYIPIVISNQAWALLMFWEWLVDRIGGEQVWESCVQGEWEACWNDPAMLEATEKIVELKEHGAFADNWASVDYGAGGSEPLMTTGKGVFYLMGSWGYTSMLTADPDYVKENFGFTKMPAVTGGKGDPTNVVGNPTRSVIITNKAKLSLAQEFTKELTTDQFIKDAIAGGQVPTNKNAADFASESETPEFTQFLLEMIGEANYFTQSWDVGVTSLGSTVEPEMERILLGEITPEEFIAAALTMDPNA
ncbi:MAG: extracellular solute-binding protein [Bifidobacteriaceae bacterium]|nr:extracellular solute-binding protein [Bifidobacteriaceae bacterium]